MRPEQSVEIQLVDEKGDRLCIGDVIVQVEFFVSGRYRFGFKVGRTDDSGCLRVSYIDIDRQRRRNAARDLMDYNTTLDDCDEQIRVVVPTEGKLREQIQNVTKFYGKPPIWATSWPANSRIDAEPAMATLRANLTAVFITSRRA